MKGGLENLNLMKGGVKNSFRLQLKSLFVRLCVQRKGTTYRGPMKNNKKANYFTTGNTRLCSLHVNYERDLYAAVVTGSWGLYRVRLKLPMPNLSETYQHESMKERLLLLDYCCCWDHCCCWDYCFCCWDYCYCCWDCCRIVASMQFCGNSRYNYYYMVQRSTVKLRNIQRDR
ncbi:uncharacterized protein LOC129717845 [Wyeomyia smithii]|uniref:uncharacterized protein LOC129717845 n=1 Tax=Wyeomyia smithii TaxID=174621 RepID=UPI002467C2C4|nr:uncharacterized protein LOC129717845 [Wyeomyia smithii]